MTCIVGYIDKAHKRLVIGGDSAASSNNDITIRKDPKVFKKGPFIFGCTSSYRMIQLLRYSLVIPEYINPALYVQADLHEYMCTSFINAVRECFKEGGYIQKTTMGDEQGGKFLVGYKDRIFEIDNDFQVGESFSGIYAIGCGSDYALGSLFAQSRYNLTPEDMANGALEAATYFSSGVRNPFIIESMEF